MMSYIVVEFRMYSFVSAWLVTGGHIADGPQFLPCQAQSLPQKTSIPVPFVRQVDWPDSPALPRCRRCAAQAEAALRQGLEAALMGTGDDSAEDNTIRSKHSILTGVWTDLRIWDWPCAHHRTKSVLISACLKWRVLASVSVCFDGSLLHGSFT